MGYSDSWGVCDHDGMAPKACFCLTKYPSTTGAYVTVFTSIYPRNVQYLLACTNSTVFVTEQGMYGSHRIICVCIVG